ncbi:beta-(1--_2)glucan export ATP-binding/permease protein NdvA [Siccirubricoccus deserti]|uniref:Glucan ABC transporter ATP-binding protein/ permease n=1 Tax=Siccirubricoccus deserti TaxID=2013562 RepID=A0A9X0QWY9_9PROT|nr:glucan ABC transporter ATP-binding protein/ permease [Siccirubricoccus deserti]MBC4015120.1 glucan ABC transporter ATP-binding protein/ permease [Siccirubricoccus deserti]GGC38796.1 beta-(1-->2)glucan export ATP-binding/permease protein NdvA [Siccirubricoccus deserti]
MHFTRLYGRVLGLLAADRWVAIGLATANAALAGLLFLEPVLFGRVVDVLSHSLSMPRSTVWEQALALLALWGAVGLSGIGANVAVSLLADRMAHRNRLAAMHRFFEHVIALPLSFHGDVQSGRLMKVMLVGSDNLFSMWLSFFRDHMSTFVAILILLPLTLAMNWRLSLLLIGLVVVFSVITAFVIQKTEAAQGEVERFQTRLAGNAQDALANVMVVQSFTRLSSEARMFGDIVRQVLDHQFPVLNWWAVVNVLTRAASTITTISIFVLGTVLHLDGKATVGEIVSFMGFATLLIGKLEGAVAFVSRLVFQAPAIQEFFEVMDATSSVPEKPGALALGRVEGAVAFERVAFAYPGGSRILTDVDFVAPPGRTIALVGQTGAGKSTAMALLQRLWDPVEGRITVDGHDLRDITLESLRRNTGVVFQESMLFNRTIRDNLLVGRPEATQEELESACRMAEAHDFVIRQPRGYDTQVGERGSSLSGGQRQRLAIARALLKDPPILILDEATSALDAATEARVQRALKALMAGRTTFIIAHRLSTVRDADEILVFEGGRIVERGSFDALVREGGRFAELVRTQLNTDVAVPAAAAVKAAE